jgi:outer membrane protein assembly factor BamB
MSRSCNSLGQKFSAPALIAPALILLGAASTSAQSAGAPAVTFQMDIGHTGVTSFSNTLKFPLAAAWSLDFGAAVSYPLIANGKIYVTFENPTGGYGTNLIALDERTGATVWGPVSIPGTYDIGESAFDNDTIFVINFDGLLFSFNAENGAPGWSVQLPNQYAFTSPPTATNGVVYVGGSGSGGTLYAVSEANGAVLWSKSVENGDNSSPAVGNGIVYVSYVCPQVYAFAIGDGAPIWHNNPPCEGGGGNTPVLNGGTLYVRDYIDAQKGYTFNAASGAPGPRFDADTMPAIGASTGYFLHSKVLSAISLADLTSVAWTFTGDGYLTSAPIVVDNAVFVGSSNRNIYALDAQTGNVVWSMSLGDSITTPDEFNATILTGLGAGDGLVVVPATNHLYVFESDPIFADGFEGN